MKHKGKIPALELLNEQNFENTKENGVIFEFFGEKFFSLNLQEKPLFADIEYAGNDRCFADIGPMEKNFSRKY